jgi:hypothetical protein
MAVSAAAGAPGRPVADVSHHLLLLRAPGVLTGTREGRFVRYALDRPAAVVSLI